MDTKIKSQNVPLHEEPTEPETAEERHQRIWKAMRTPPSAAELAARAEARERLEALITELGDAAITEEDVAEYLAEQEALGLHHPLKHR